MTSFAARFGVAGVDEEPVGPGLEPVRIPQPGQVLPRVEQRPLRGILGQVRVTQDPPRDRMEVVAHAPDQSVERRFVAVHRPLDESPLHPSPLADPSGAGSRSMSRRRSDPFKRARGIMRGAIRLAACRS